MKNNLISVSLILILVFGGMPSILAQQSKEDKKQEKEARKKVKEEKDLADWNESRDMAVKKQFVFKATQLYTNSGSIALDSKINFFYVLDDYAVIQFGLDGILIGGNGVGGVTTTGDVIKYEIKADNPKKIVQVEITVKPHVGQGTGIHPLVVKFYGDGYGEVLLTTSGTRFRGKFAKPEEAIIHEGNKQ